MAIMSGLTDVIDAQGYVVIPRVRTPVLSQDLSELSELFDVSISGIDIQDGYESDVPNDDFLSDEPSGDRGFMSRRVNRDTTDYIPLQKLSSSDALGLLIVHKSLSGWESEHFSPQNTWRRRNTLGLGGVVSGHEDGVPYASILQVGKNFVGGDLWVETRDGKVTLPLGYGDMAVINGKLNNGTAPVTAGTRVSLVSLYKC